MRILVSNDDGIFAPGLWALAKALKSIAQVVVVAPDREQSARGTAVTLQHPLRAQQVTPLVPDVEAYAVEGFPSDSVILALGKLLQEKIDMVVSGINQGPNLGNDVLISGTVGAAMQGHLRGLPALAISVTTVDNSHLASAGRAAAELARLVERGRLPTSIFLNVNMPAGRIKGVSVTRLADKSHIDTVEEGFDGRRKYYWLIRKQLNKNNDKDTDIWAVEHGNVSITPLHPQLLHSPSPLIPPEICSELAQAI